MNTAKWVLIFLLTLRTAADFFALGGGVDKVPLWTWKQRAANNLASTLTITGLLWWAGFWK